MGSSKQLLKGNSASPFIVWLPMKMELVLHASSQGNSAKMVRLVSVGCTTTTQVSTGSVRFAVLSLKGVLTVIAARNA